jgi:hypothetical protein
MQRWCIEPLRGGGLQISSWPTGGYSGGKGTANITTACATDDRLVGGGLLISKRVNHPGACHGILRLCLIATHATPTVHHVTRPCVSPCVATPTVLHDTRPHVNSTTSRVHASIHVWHPPPSSMTRVHASIHVWRMSLCVCVCGQLSTARSTGRSVGRSHSQLAYRSACHPSCARSCLHVRHSVCLRASVCATACA